MKAARWYEKGDIRVEDIPIPEPGPGEVRIKVKACGICGSDLHEYNAGPFIIPRRPHPLTGRELGPVTLGHEFSGDLDALGEGVSGWEKGEKVTANPLIYCGECVGCKSGQHLLCSKLATAGFAADGAFAEYIVVPAYGLTRLADNIDYDMGAFVEPLAVAVRAVRRSGLQMGQTVAIIGGGPIGLLVALVCKALEDEISDDRVEGYQILRSLGRGNMALVFAARQINLDRIVALTLGMDSIRDVVAFPKTASAADLMCEAPSTVETHQMSELHIRHEGLEPTGGDSQP